MGEGPVRIQLSRAKGWRMPENTVKVDRSTRWGSPFVVGGWAKIAPGLGATDLPFRIRDASVAVLLFRLLCEDHQPNLSALRGKNLACWCKAGSPCHADVLLELANAPPQQRGRG